MADNNKSPSLLVPQDQKGSSDAIAATKNVSSETSQEEGKDTVPEKQGMTSSITDVTPSKTSGTTSADTTKTATDETTSTTRSSLKEGSLSKSTEGVSAAPSTATTASAPARTSSLTNNETTGGADRTTTTPASTAATKSNAAAVAPTGTTTASAATTATEKTLSSPKLRPKVQTTSSSSPTKTRQGRSSSPPSTPTTFSVTAAASKAFEAMSEAVNDVRSAASDVASTKAASASSGSNYHDGFDYNVMTPYQIFGSKILGKTVYGEFECTNRHHFGSLFMGSRALCFYGKLFGLERKIIMPYGMIHHIERYKSNGILVRVDSKANSLTDTYGNPLPSPPPPKFSPKNSATPSPTKKPPSLPVSMDDYVFYVDLATLDTSGYANTNSEHTTASTESTYNSSGSFASDMDDVLNLFLDLKERFRCGFLADDDILGTTTGPKEPPTSTMASFPPAPPTESPPRRMNNRAAADDLRISVRYMPHPMYRRSNTAPNSPKKDEGESEDLQHEKSVHFDDSQHLNIDLIDVGETKEPSSQDAAATAERKPGRHRPSNSQALAAVTAMADFRSFSIVYGSKEKQQELAKMTYDLEHEDTPTTTKTEEEQTKETEKTTTTSTTDQQHVTSDVAKKEEADETKPKGETEISHKEAKESPEAKEEVMEMDDGPEDPEDQHDIPNNIDRAWLKVKDETPTQYKEGALKLHLPKCSSVDKFFDLFLANDAPYSIATYMEHHGDTDLNVTKWKLSKRQFVTKRLVEYVHPVNAPMAPPQAAAQKRQWMRRYGKDKTKYIVVDTKTTVSDVPMTDCFYMQDRWLIESTGEQQGGITLTVNFQVTFVKSTMFRRIIEKTSKEEFCKFISAYGKMIQQSLQKEEEKAKMALPVTITPPVAKKEAEEVPPIPKEEEVKKEEEITPSPPTEVAVAAAATAEARPAPIMVTADNIFAVLPTFLQQILKDPKKVSLLVMSMGLFILLWMFATFVLTYMTYQLWKEVTLLRQDITYVLKLDNVPAGEFVEDIGVPIINE